MKLRVRFAAAFVVTPSRGQEGAGKAPRGSKVEITDEIRDRLEKLFDEELKSKIQIKFIGRPKQQNAIRDLIRTIARDQGALAASTQLARALGLAMDTRSRQSLLLVLAERPQRAGQVAVHLLKFPNDNSLSAEERGGQLVLKLLDRAFTAESSNFKAANFTDDPAAATSFWKGQVEDRQARLAGGQVANYWIDSFLRAELEASSGNATNAVADALKDQLKDVTGADAVALTSAAQVLARAKRRLSFEGLASRYLPSALRDGFLERVRRDYKFDPETVFDLDPDILDEQFGYKVLSLENQVSVSAPAASFDRLVTVERSRNDQMNIRTSGRYAGTKLRRRAV